MPTQDLGQIPVIKRKSELGQSLALNPKDQLIAQLSEARQWGVMPSKFAVDPQSTNKAKDNFFRSLGMALSTGAMAYAEGMGAGKPYSNFIEMQKAREKNATDLELAKIKESSPVNAFKAQRENRIADAQLNSIALRLRSEFNSSPIKKEFDTLNRSFRQMAKAYDISTNENTKSRIASDQALGVMIQKMLDPTSVVRESEYARTPEGAAVMSRLEAFVPKLQKGGMAISNADRKAILDMANAMVDAGGELYNQHIDRYSASALEYGVDPNKIITGVKRYEPFGKVGEPSGTDVDVIDISDLLPKK